MNETSDLEKAIVAARHFETLLKDRYRAWGNGLGGKTRSVIKNLREDVVQNLLYVSGVSNKMRHEKVDAFSDKVRFEKACAELEHFFKEAIVSESPAQPSWLEPHQIGFIPQRLESSQQKRLFTIDTGKVTVYSPGTHRVRKSWGAVDAGYVCMLPLPLQRFTASPLRSKDDLELRMSIELSAVISDDDASIKSIILTEEQQIETAQSQALLCIQQICAERDYSNITRSLHDIADSLTTSYNSRRAKIGSGCAFAIAHCAIVECALEDAEIEETKRQQRRTIEDAKRKTAEHSHTAELEKLQFQIEQERTRREREHAMESQQHSDAIQNLKSETEAKVQRLEIELKNERARHEATNALAASKQSIEIQSNIADAEMKGIPVAKAKAAVYASPGGPEILHRQDAFELKALELRKQTEVLRSILTDGRFKDFMMVARTAGFNEAQIDSLNNYQRLLERSFGAPETQINVSRPEPETPGKDTL